MSKKKAGPNKVNKIKTSNFLPNVFQTDINKSWLDSTLDQMVSKGPLGQVNGYIGNNSGKYSVSTDKYITPSVDATIRNKTQLAPAIVSYNNNQDLTNKISFDDITYAINQNFNAYNYNASYSSSKFTFSPPINVDKFLNFKNYRWVEEMPVYESVYTGANKDPLIDMLRVPAYKLTDDNNSFVLEVGMIIKFSGTGWDSTVKDKTYLVTANNPETKLELYKDSNGVKVYNSYSKLSKRNYGVWDTGEPVRVSPNTANSYWATSNQSPQALVDAYNADTNRLPLFDGFIFGNEDSNPAQFKENTLIRFTAGWVHNGQTTNTESIYITQVDASTKDVSFKKLVDATFSNNKWTATNVAGITANELALINSLDGHDEDNEKWDHQAPLTPNKDYIVIDRGDVYQTAWSRTNSWVNFATINKVQELIPTHDFTEILNENRIAQRPIIEYNEELNLWNYAEKSLVANKVGKIDYGVVSGEDLSVLPIDATYVYIDNSDTKVYQKTALNFVAIKTLADNDVMQINSVANPAYADWRYADVYYKNNTITLGQQKTKINQYPLYKFYNCEGIPLEDIYSTGFAGEKIFGYKVGTGTFVDPEINHVLSYKDTPKGAEYEFENFLLTKNYKKSYDDTIQNIRYAKPLAGYNHIKNSGNLETFYKPSGTLTGAKETKQYEITIPDTALTIPVGKNNWRPEEEYNVIVKGNVTVLAKCNNDGTYNESVKKTRHLVGVEQTFTLNNLTGKTITFLAGPVDIENPGGNAIPDMTITRSGSKITIVTGSNSDGDHFTILADNTEIASMTISKDWDELFYNVKVNGNPVPTSLVSANATTLVIDQSLFTTGDLVDFVWTNNDASNPTTNISFPETLEHNANNKRIYEFTMSETIDHWLDKLTVNPGYSGTMFGDNNYSSIVHTPYYGGTMFVHPDISIMHDINYSDKDLNITAILNEQANDWYAFRKRFLAQVKRLYTVGSNNSSIKLLTESAIKEIIRNKKDSELYNNSNMVYHNTYDIETFTITDTTVKEFKTKFDIHGDQNIRDHVYVYLTENDGNNKQVERILLKDTDYDIIGDTVYLKLTYAALDNVNTNPILNVVYNQMDNKCYIPPSMVKLGLAYGMQPQVVGSTLYTHDGDTYTLTGQITDVTGANFDPVHAALFDLEKRIYAGLPVQDLMYRDDYCIKDKYKSATDYMPSQHISTWYKLADIDNYLEKFYQTWANKNEKTSLNIANYYDQTDPFTWNYSSLSIGNKFGTNKLPGHYKGAYMTVFGTSTPHLTPWHMLGYSFKPTWWDTYFSWTDATKRTALLNALSNGIVKPQASPDTEQDIKYARRYWDFTNNCPVDTNGDLVNPDTVLGAPTASDAAQEFVFGDWGPVEIEWRQSALGQAMTVNAMLKLNPTRAWSDYFQPGKVRDYYTSYTKRYLNSSCFTMPGETYKTINSIKILSSSGLTDTNEFYLLDSYDSVLGTARFKSTGGKITATSMVGRGTHFTGEPILSYSDSMSGVTVSYELELKEVSYVANGISQAQHNYILRKQLDKNFKELYNNLTTKLLQKLEGYSSKHLLNIFGETSYYGDFEFGDSDYNISMYEGTANDFVNASIVLITKTPDAYTVTGVADNKREFKFFEPNISNGTDFELQTINGATVRRYNKFVSTPSTLEFGSKVSKIQDVYSFVRGYWKYLESQGYNLQFEGDQNAADFVNWTNTAEENDTYILQIGRRLTYTPESGSVYPYNELSYNNNSILDMFSNKIEQTDLSISRKDGIVSVETKNQKLIGSITTASTNFEHALIFENTTALGVTVYDDVKNKRQHRLLVRGQLTQEWNGEKKAPGYLVFGDHIVENFDSAVQAVDDIYRTDVDEFNKSITKSKDLAIGNIDKVWLDGLGLNKNTITRFHQGSIKQQGTKGAVERFGRSTLLDGGKTSLSVFEQYMFRQSTLGNDDLQEPFEMELVSNDIINLPLAIDLTSVDTTKIINDVATTFETLSYDDSSSDILTGGETLTTETKYHIANLTKMKYVFDSTDSYATIPTWNSTTSYKKDDLVRHNGQLWKCSVNFTGLTELAPNITEIGTVTNPVFPSGTVANIAGTTVTFNDTATEYQDIEAVGTVVSPTFLPSETLIIDGVSIGFTKTENVTIVTGNAVITGNVANPSINDVTGKQITINGSIVDFDTTPADVVETKSATNQAPADATETNTATASQTDFTVSAQLSPSTWSVLKVEVDSTPTTNYTVAGQVVTINNPAMVGGETVDITVTHQPIIQTAYTINQTLSNTTYSVASVTVAGVVTSNWTVNGQVLTLTSAPSLNDAVVITLTHVPDNMNTAQIVAQINNAGITGVTAGLVANSGFLQIIFTTTDPTATLTLASGSSNTDLGFLAGGSVVAPPTEIGQQSTPLNLSEIVQQINNTTNLSNVVASADSNRLKLTSTNITLSVTGSAQTILGLSTAYTATTVTAPIDTTMNSAITQIQNALTSASNTEVTITADANRIKIVSEGTSLLLGDTTFNSIAGINTGTLNAASGTIQNTFDINDFGGVPVDSSLDPATFNILVTDDSEYENASVESINTKFFGYNIFQVTQNNVPLYSESTDGTHCGICAGTATSDGNDAEVTTNTDHGLQVGDFVMLLNTTTTPNIDGIHKVTKLGSGTNSGRIFYIDEFIKECGNAVSVMPLVTTRFATTAQRDSALIKTHWNLPTGTIVVASRDTNNVRGTYVSSTSLIGTGLNEVRQTIARPTNTDIDSIIIYNHKSNQTKVQLEAFDPMRKVIPGIAEQNLDYSNVNDNAIYNTTTDENRFTDNDNAWGSEQVGTRWWDTSQVRYFDYDQGDNSYRKDMWGKLFPGSEIVVWEWIKSTVAPDDYAESVEQQKEMFGVPATGEAYIIYDTVAKETNYYYTQEQEYNVSTGNYDDVYYFWVKNKTTINDTRTLSAFDVANIIENPSANGISWFAVLDNNTFIIDNVSFYVEDTSTVLQINKAGDKFKSHNEWTLITKDLDTIPEYYVEGMKYNLSGWDKDSSKIPFTALHKFNKYGDDLDSGQTWFNNLITARRNAIITINDLLTTVNLYDEYRDSWNKTLVANNFPRYLWKWKDYKLETYLGNLNYTATVTSSDQLETTIDKTLDKVVQLPIYDTDLKLDRSEIYYYNEDKWILVHKKNSTVEFDVDLLCPTGGYDNVPFDSRGWDHANVAGFWQTLIEALKKDIFVQYHKLKMNKLFFSIIDYTLSSFAQTNWIRKTTYVKVEIDSQIDTTSRAYKKDNLVNALGYIQDIKPFHTKISTVKTNYKVIDEATLTVTETPKHVITMNTQDFTPTFNGTTYVGADSTDIVTGGDFTSTPADTIEAINFLSPYNFNVNEGEKRNSFVNINPLELLRINVQTNQTGNTTANSSRTFTHIQDAAGNVKAYALLESRKSTLTSAIDEDSTDLSLASTTAFDDTGLVYIGGEIIEYAKTDATTLKIMKRAVGQTFIVSADTGDAVVQISNYQLTFANDTVSYNQTGGSLLSTPVSEPAQELQDFGRGIEL
jgi:hypothetical protein